ncbi:hypothetical protein NPIL_609411 [Nephila pilipes]|uniref:Uncharacterized protein n=1 Tax=Nephila pilipes TaxID=299642 RepID=A0A8X6JV87_NEPPI|nr:hypothetical protein NPIL_609411 [Nephila pilipes]
MAQIRAKETAERRAARLDDVRLGARQSRSAASNLFRSQQNKHDSSISIVFSYYKALKSNEETKGMYFTAEKVKLPQLRETPEELNTLLARCTAANQSISYLISENTTHASQ